VLFGEALQAPFPSQPPAAQMAEFAGQAASAVLMATGRQAPAELHALHVPQAAPALNVHVGLVPSQLLEHVPVLHKVRVPCGVAAAGKVVHTPSCVVTSQAWHEPLQALLQHKPSTQWAFVHCASALHLLPSATVPQLPLTQGAPEQSPLPAQCVAQVVPLHLNGVHATGVAG
jgi:hypothetical protein